MSYVEALLVEAMKVCDWVLKEGRFRFVPKSAARPDGICWRFEWGRLGKVQASGPRATWLHRDLGKVLILAPWHPQDFVYALEAGREGAVHPPLTRDLVIASWPQLLASKSRSPRELRSHGGQRFGFGFFLSGWAGL